MRYRLRKLLVLLAVVPPLLGGCFGSSGPQPTQPPPALLGSWTTDSEPRVTLSFFPNASLHVCNHSDGRLRKWEYRWRGESLIELSVNEDDYKGRFLMTVDDDEANERVTLRLPDSDPGKSEGASFISQPLVLRRLEQD